MQVVARQQNDVAGSKHEFLSILAVDPDTELTLDDVVIKNQVRCWPESGRAMFWRDAGGHTPWREEIGVQENAASQVRGHVRPCNLKPQQRDLTHVLRRPVEPATNKRHHAPHSIRDSFGSRPPGACRPRKTCNCLPCQPSEQNIRSKRKDVLAVGFFLQRQARLASTHRVTSPFPGSLHPKIHHIHRPADFRDVYAGIGLDSRPYDAISDVFLALPPVPAELHALRLHLACSGRLF
jgi:hypothetical protein